MTDYSRLLDAEIRAFVDRTNGFYPPDAAGLSTEENRRLYDTMCAAFASPRPPGLGVAEATIAEVPVRRYRPEAPGPVRVVYAHGGGFVLGGLDSHDGVCADIAHMAGLEVVAVDYRLAPEHRHPAQLDDCLNVARAVAAEGPILLAGDSAGGNLAAATALALRGAADLRGLVLIYPGLGGSRGTGSHATHAEAPMLSAAEVELYAGIRGNTPGDPTAEPMLAELAGLPPVFASAAECDPLADDAVNFCEKVRAAGGEARAVVEPGVVHGHLRARLMSARAAEAFAAICTAISEFAQR